MSVFPKNSKVIELTPSDFDKSGKITHNSLEGNKKAMICFTASWCGWCVKMKTPYSKTAAILGDSFPMFNLDCVKYADFAKDMGINGFPTIKYIQRSGKIGKDYSGDRDVNGFLADICIESRQCRSQ